jgi:hypothetical protein
MLEFTLVISTDFFGNNNFQPLFLARKKKLKTFKVTFVADGQLSALLTLRMTATDNSKRLF